ncbi:translesion error-prone DNA polymerase V autoproteolytic subunit [Flavobacterium alkalisoli]|uniref:Translesion error-prone DNA polymerase V autoproteolytic subunit n=1 Tax=Flavobacterium alkalisoli TaxID=2602769 RepID=A0A5B9FNE7_9FLAO|nr:translesion error-prone DNA polymerase V autoproteolytic subunit [Flavobacterium alkalisoli]QEE48524.1 translesion error-prone DNA polymerase V autoproteolytic subunit [Flavobacterium alkalisoli]
MLIASNKYRALNIYAPDMESKSPLPYISHGVSAGFPSPAQDFMETKIDLNRELSKNPLSTFYIRVSGNSMIDAGINNADILVVDRSMEPSNGKIAVCLVDGEFTVKRLVTDTDCLYLMPENKAYTPIKITENNQFVVWGIVTYVIKKVA